MDDQPRQKIRALYCPLCGGRLWLVGTRSLARFIVLVPPNEINVLVTIGAQAGEVAMTRVEMSRKAGLPNIISTTHNCPAVFLKIPTEAFDL